MASIRARHWTSRLPGTVTAADLRPLNPDNIFTKFAKDTYLVISVASISTMAAEIDNIAAWAAENNLKLN